MNNLQFILWVFIGWAGVGAIEKLWVRVVNPWYAKWKYRDNRINDELLFAVCDLAKTCLETGNDAAWAHAQVMKVLNNHDMELPPEQLFFTDMSSIWATVLSANLVKLHSVPVLEHHNNSGLVYRQMTIVPPNDALVHDITRCLASRPTLPK